MQVSTTQALDTKNAANIYINPLFREESYEVSYDAINIHHDTLEKAIKKKDLYTIHTLLITGADPNVVLKEHKYLPLMLAAELGQQRSVALLLKYVANPNLRSAHGHTSLSLAANFEPDNNSDHTDIAQLL
ncbi:MAG: ankyrin repeat domain-containing protein [Rickettsiella sp.]|nr:ankyrin repeat domain-containing protein [Rickettsiella sp.]